MTGIFNVNQGLYFKFFRSTQKDRPKAPGATARNRRAWNAARAHLPGCF